MFYPFIYMHSVQDLTQLIKCFPRVQKIFDPPIHRVEKCLTPHPLGPNSTLIHFKCLSSLTSYSANHTRFSIFQQYIAMPIMAGYSATSHLKMTKSSLTLMLYKMGIGKWESFGEVTIQQPFNRSCRRT